MFSAPAAFLWLALVVPALVVLYLFRQQTRIQAVPSIIHMLALPDASVPVRRRFARFVRDPFFYLQLLLLFLLISALAEPIREKKARHSVFILDVTASMQAKEGSATRIELAIQRALEILESYESADRVAVLAGGRNVRRIVPFTSKRTEQVDGLRSIEATDTSGDCRKAIYTAANMLLSAGGGEIVLFTDSPLSIPEGIEKEGLGIRIEGIGIVRQNVGIVTVETPHQLLQKELHLVVHIRSFNRDPVECEVSLEVNGEEVSRRKTRIPARGIVTESFKVSEQAGMAQVKLHMDDALEVDNHGYAYLPQDKSTSIKVVSSRPSVFEFLGKLESLELNQISPESYTRESTTGADLFVFDGWNPPEIPESSALYISPGTDSALFKVLGHGTGEPYYWNQGHPLIDGIALDNLKFDQFSRLELSSGAEVVIGAKESPLLATAELDGKRFVVCAMPLGDMLEEPSAVLLLFKILEWCGRPAGYWATSFPAGESLVCKLPAEQKVADLVTPSGETQSLLVSDDRLYYENTDRIGVYKVKAGNFERVFVANLSSALESDLSQPVESMELAAARSGSSSKALSSYSPWLLAIAPFLFLFEWMAFLGRLRREEKVR